MKMMSDLHANHHYAKTNNEGDDQRPGVGDLLYGRYNLERSTLKTKDERCKAHADDVTLLKDQHVSVRCIFRLFHVHEGIYAMVFPTNLYFVIEKAADVGETVTKSYGEAEDVKSLNSSQESKVEKKSKPLAKVLHEFDLPPAIFSLSRLENTLITRACIDTSIIRGSFDDMVDQRLEGNYNRDKMHRMVACAAICLRHAIKRRPRMSQGDNSGSNLGKRKSVTSTTPKGKKVKAEGKEKSEWWQYYEVLYEKDEDGNRRKIAKCKYCETRLVADNGTSTLRKHITQSCKQNPTRLEDKQGTLQFKLDNSVEGGTSSVATWKHDDDRIYKALIKLFVIGELPFAFVKNEAFVEYTQALNASIDKEKRRRLYCFLDLELPSQYYKDLLFHMHVENVELRNRRMIDDMVLTNSIVSKTKEELTLLNSKLKLDMGICATLTHKDPRRKQDPIRREVRADEVLHALIPRKDKCPHYTKDCPLKEEGEKPSKKHFEPSESFRTKNEGKSMNSYLSKFMSESAKRHEENSNLIKEIRASTDVAIRNQGASIKTLEIQIRKMSKVLQERGFRSLPSYTENYLRGPCQSISTSVETYYTDTQFAVLEDMDAYRDEGTGDVIFGEPFLREVGINTKRFKGVITIHNGNEEVTYQMCWYFSFGRHLDELHVTWAHLEKKRMRLRTNTKTLEDLCSQSLETASQAIHDAVTTHQEITQNLATRAIGITIELPEGNKVVPLRSDTIRLVQNGCSFHGLRSEDPSQHLKDFPKLVDSLDLDGENRERMRLRYFYVPYSDSASNWLLNALYQQDPSPHSRILLPDCLLNSFPPRRDVNSYSTIS
ncbi:zinc finger BED domain-containing protein RICESLEEPER 2 [Tanacetum coccineum]